jgi:hypothetical protein
MADTRSSACIVVRAAEIRAGSLRRGWAVAIFDRGGAVATVDHRGSVATRTRRTVTFYSHPAERPV